MTDLLSRVLPPKPTDAQLAEAKPIREAFRKDVDTRLTQVSESAPAFKTIHIDISPLQTLLNKTSTWIQENVEVTKRDLETEQTRFQEEYQTIIRKIQKNIEQAITLQNVESVQKVVPYITIPELKSKLENTIKQLTDTQRKEKVQKEKELQTRTVSDDIGDISKQIGKYFAIFVYVLVALRLAAYAANASIHLPISFRILNFMYTFLFAPFLLLYWGYFVIRNWIWPDIYDAPLIEGLLPLRSYDASQPLSFADRLIGFPSTGKLMESIAKKMEQLLGDRKKALESTVLADLQSESG